MRRSLHVVLLICLLAVAGQTFGCSTPYMRNRGNDLADLIDIGITVSPHWKPDFALHANFFNSTPFGYSHIDGKYLGFGYRQIGVMDFHDRTWGALLYGREDFQFGEFNPNDPHQAPADEIAALKAEGKRLPERMDVYEVGVIGMHEAGRTPPKPTFGACRKNLHLGWIGIWNICRPVDLVDFVLGWGGVDFMGDDLAG